MDAEAIAAQEEADWAGLEELDVDEYLLGIEGDDDGANGGGDGQQSSAANDDFGAGNQVCAGWRVNAPIAFKVKFQSTKLD